MVLQKLVAGNQTNRLLGYGSSVCWCCEEVEEFGEK
jgi:hypothetical protein